MSIKKLLLTIAAVLCLLGTVHAVPNSLHWQGKVYVQTLPFNGTGQFKFILHNGSSCLWSNSAGSSCAALTQPASAVSLNMTQGLYSLNLGDTALANMAALPASVFSGEPVYLRIWFNDGVNGFQQLSPDETLSSVPFAMFTNSVGTANVATMLSSANVIIKTGGVERLRVNSLGNVGIGTSAPNANAILDVSSNTKAFLPPRMTTTQRNAIASPIFGMLIYNSTTQEMNVYANGAWRSVGLSLSGGTVTGNVSVIGNLTATDTFVARTNTLVVSSNGNVGIGNTTPNTKLDVNGGFSIRRATVNITADDQLITVGNRSYIRLVSNGSTAASRTFCLTAGLTPGQILVIENTENTFSAQIQDGAQTCVGAVQTRLTGLYSMGGGGDTITLMYNGSFWLELARANN